MDKKIISIDFDGVLHSYTSGWQGADVIPDAPVSGAIEWLKALLADERFEVAIFSSRNHQEGGSWAMMTWLVKYGLLPSEVAEIDFPIRKPAAHLSLDDRGFHFAGRFPTPDEINAFKPWYKGGQDVEALMQDAITGLAWALEKLPDECDCPPENCYMERDTGALIHDGEHCVSTLRGHIEVVLEKMKAITAGNGDSRQS